MERGESIYRNNSNQGNYMFNPKCEDTSKQRGKGGSDPITCICPFTTE
jgi:hypothetical protein